MVPTPVAEIVELLTPENKCGLIWRNSRKSLRSGDRWVVAPVSKKNGQSVRVRCTSDSGAGILELVDQLTDAESKDGRSLSVVGKLVVVQAVCSKRSPAFMGR